MRIKSIEAFRLLTFFLSIEHAYRHAESKKANPDFLILFFQFCTRPAHRVFPSTSLAVVMVLVCLQVVTSAPSSSISPNTSSSRCPDDGINLEFTAGIHLDVSHLIDGESPKPWSIPRSSQLSIPCNESNLSPRQCHRAVYTQEGATEVSLRLLELWVRVLYSRFPLLNKWQTIVKRSWQELLLIIDNTIVNRTQPYTHTSIANQYSVLGKSNGRTNSLPRGQSSLSSLSIALCSTKHHPVTFQVLLYLLALFCGTILHPPWGTLTFS